MHKSPLMRFLGMASWLITALASINMGLSVMGRDVLATDFVQMNFPWIVVPFFYLVGVAGVLSLVMFFMACSCSEC